MDIIIYLFTFISIVSVTIFIALNYKERLKLPPYFKEQIIGDYNIKASHKEKESLIFKYTLHPINSWLLDKFGIRERVNDQLMAAEVKLLPEDFLGMKEFLIVGLLILVYFFNNGRLELPYIFGSVLLGYFMPEFYLKKKLRRKKYLISKTLPDSVDLLSLCLQGGMGFMTGLKWVILRSPKGPLINEFSLVLQEMNIGKPRQQALKDMARRLAIPEITSLINAIVHAERMGTSLGSIMKTVAEETRRQRFTRGERLALKAPIKMLFPLILFILPIVGIIVGGPILIKFSQSGKGLF